MDHTYSNIIQLPDLPNKILNAICNKLGFKDFIALYLVCKRFPLLLNDNKPIAFQRTISNIKKSMPTSTFHLCMLESLIIEDYIWKKTNFTDFTNLKTLEIVDSCKVDPSPNTKSIQLTLPQNLKTLKLTSTFLPQNRDYNVIVIDATRCLSPLEVFELNGTISKGKATAFMLIYPFITSVQAISLSNAYIGFAIFNYMQENLYAINNFNVEDFEIFECKEKSSVQLQVNKSVHPPIETFEILCSYQICRWNSKWNGELFNLNLKEEYTLEVLPGIYVAIVTLPEGQSIVLNHVAYKGIGISPQKWRYEYGQTTQRLTDKTE